MARKPHPEEREWQSFTKIEIYQLNAVYVKQYDPKYVRQRLGHIYHYYLWGPNGNREDLPDGDQRTHYECVDICVDGVSIAQSGGAELHDLDQESIYLQTGVRPFTFDFKLSATVDVRSGTVVDSNPIQPTQYMASQGSHFMKKMARVEGVILYYPYRAGRETLPIPLEKRRMRSDLGGVNDASEDYDDDIDMSEREFGFEIFWNGRLLPMSHIPTLQFTKRTKAGPPSQCYKRIKGMLFLDSNFRVSLHHVIFADQETEILE